MEFFDWINVPQMIVNYLQINVDSPDAAAALMFRIQIISIAVAAGLYLASLLCGGFGLMKMAKRAGIKYWWLGFLPFGNTYLTGKLAGEANIFGQKCKRIGLYVSIAEVIYVGLEIFLLVISSLLINGDFYALKTVTSEATGEVIREYFYFSEELFLAKFPEFAWMIAVSNVVSIIAQVWWFVMLFLFCIMFSAFFRKYYARSPFLMTFLCAFLPLRGFVLLAVRNNEPVDYQAYMRRRYEQMRSAQAGQPYGGGYGGSGNYGQPTEGQGNNPTSGSPAGDPFSEFGGGSTGGNNGGNAGGNEGSSGGSQGGSPFSDF